MKRSKLVTLLLAVITLCGFSLPMTADDHYLIYSGDTGRGVTGWRGTVGNPLKQDYDVAIKIADPQFVGLTIEAIRVPLEGVEHLSDLKVWLTKELKLETVNGKKTNVPDIMSVDASANTGMVEVKLNQPYTIPAEGVYVGYSFKMDELDETNRYPLRITTELHTGGMYIHSSKNYRSWIDVSDQCSSAMQVLLGGAAEHAVSVSPAGVYFGAINKQIPVTFMVENHGSSGIKTLDYAYDYAGSHYTGTATPEVEVQPVYSAYSYITFNLPEVAQKGYYPIDLRITKVNGADNTEPDASVNQTMSVVDVVPKHRALMEEYSGTWCGFCPRGFVGLEVMNRLYPDDFIGLSYHSGDGSSQDDPMEVMNGNTDFPNNISGFPAAYMERKYEINAYSGYNDEATEFGVDKVWLAACELPAEASIDVKADLSADQSTVKATASVNFPLAIQDAGYEIEFVLVADSLCGEGEEWIQHNYYARKAYGEFDQPEFSQFTDAKGNVEGLKFNDVVVATSRINGLDAYLPATIEADKTYEYSLEFPLSKITNTKGQPVIQNKANLRVVAILLNNKLNTVVNAAKTKHVGNTSGIAAVTDAGDKSLPVAIYDMAGRRIQTMQQGVNIVKTADGSAYKVVRK